MLKYFQWYSFHHHCAGGFGAYFIFCENIFKANKEAQCKMNNAPCSPITIVQILISYLAAMCNAIPKPTRSIRSSQME